MTTGIYTGPPTRYTAYLEYRRDVPIEENDLLAGPGIFIQPADGQGPPVAIHGDERCFWREGETWHDARARWDAVLADMGWGRGDLQWKDAGGFATVEVSETYR